MKVKTDETKYSRAFQKLSPASADLEPYKEAFGFVFANDDVRNVAISGAYGTGKSSVVRGLQESADYKEHTYISISLAHYEERTDDRSVDSNSGAQSRKSLTLEDRLFNQLIHKTEQNRPHRSHPRQGSRSLPETALFFVFALIVALAVSVVNNFGGTLTFIESVHAVNWRLISSLVLTIAATIAAAFIFKRRIGKNTVRHLKLAEFECDLSEETDSLLDRHMDELIFQLHKCKADVVVFEDLDRYNNTGVFEKLRQLNDLANAYYATTFGTSGKQPLRFFYLVKDDLFTGKDRTKFFDFIIPIMPHVDSYNARAKLSRVLHELEIPFSEELVAGITHYVHDARAILDIANEAKQMATSLQKSGALSQRGTRGALDEEDYQNILALAAYKCTFPADYARLQFGEGYLHTLLNGESVLIDKLNGQTKDEIHGLNQILDLEEERIVQNKAELEFLFAAPELIESAASHSWNSRFATISNSFPDLDSWAGDSIEYRDIVAGVRAKNAANGAYIERAKNLELADDNFRRNVENKIASLEHDLNEHYIYDLSYLLSFDQKLADDFFDFTLFGSTLESVPDVTNNSAFDMVRMLLTGGYINASYHRYMSVFHPGALSRTDEFFVTRALASRSLTREYELDEPLKVAAELPLHRFSQTSVHNFDLYKALIDSNDRVRLAKFHNPVTSEWMVDFVIDFVLSDRFTAKVFPVLNQFWSDSIELVRKEFENRPVETRTFFQRFVAYGSEGKCAEAWRDGVQKFIDTDSEFLNVAEKDVEAFCAGMSRLDLKCEMIKEERSNQQVLEYVCDNSLYKPIPQTVAVMTIYASPASKFGKGLSDFFGVINRLKDSPVREYTFGRIETLLTKLLESPDYSPDDGIEAATELFNVEIPIELKRDYIARYRGQLNIDIDRLSNPNVVNDLLIRDFINASPHNIAKCLANLHLVSTDVLAEFINRNESSVANLSSRDLKQGNATEENVEQFLFAASALASERFITIVSNCEITFSSFDHFDIGNEKVLALIKHHALEFNLDTYAALGAQDQELLEAAIRHNPDTYAALASNGDIELHPDEVRIAVCCPEIDGEKAAALLGSLKEPVRLSESMNEKVKIEILDHYFDSNDIWTLSELRESSSEQVAEAVDRCYASLLAVGALFATDLPQESLNLALSGDSLTSQTKKRSIADLVPSSSRQEIVCALKLAGFSLLAQVVSCERHSVVISLDDPIEDRMLIEALQSRHYCGKSVELASDSLRLYYRKNDIPALSEEEYTD